MPDNNSNGSSIKIKAVASRMDANVMTFVVDQIMISGRPLRFSSKEKAAASALPEALFAIPGVSEVVIHEDSIVIRKQSSTLWPDLAHLIGAAIRAQLSTGLPTVQNPRAQQELSDADTQHLKVAIQNVLDRQINNAIKAHGGAIRCLNVMDNVVHVSMEGGCQGCAAASVTLKHGVEKKLRAAFPQIRAVIDDTEHERGLHPYFRKVNRGESI